MSTIWAYLFVTFVRYFWRFRYALDKHTFGALSRSLFFGKQFSGDNETFLPFLFCFRVINVILIYPQFDMFLSL